LNPVVYSIIAVAVDQITKAITRATMDLYDSVSILGDFFRLTYVENSGIAFGINFQGGTVVFTFLASVATVGVAWYLWKSQEADFIHRLALSLILGGAVGNLMDRFLFGRVVDFFHFSIGQYSWPVFNVADSCVTVGMVLFLYSGYVSEDGNSKTDEST
jgi:signal peptidase II